MIANAGATFGFIPFAMGGGSSLPVPGDWFLELNGANYATLATTWLPTGIASLDAKFRIDGVLAQAQTIFAGATIGNNELVMEVTSTGHVRAFIYDDLVLKAELLSLNPILPNVTYTASYSWDGATAFLHLDAVEQGNIAIVPTGSPNMGFVGRRSDGSNPLVGVILELGITGTNAISWILNSQSLTREPSEEYPTDSLKDLIYSNVVSADWNRYIPLTISGDFVKDTNGEYLYVLEH